MKLLLLNGSVAEKSHTRALLRYLEELFLERKIEIIFWDLQTKSLPHIVPEYHSDPSRHHDPIVREFVAQVDEVDGIVLGSPLYHGSYSGVLKNALDNLRKDAFRDKWVGLVGNASGPRADHVQFAHLRNVVKTLFGYVTQTQVGTYKGDYDEGANHYILSDPSIKERCQRLVNEMITVINMFQKNDYNKVK